MEERIRSEITAFVKESHLNRFPASAAPFFDAPLVGFAAGDDQLFSDYQQVIGPFHRMPVELLQDACGAAVQTATVISWILPVTATTRRSNRPQTQVPSRDWAITRNNGEQCNTALRRHLVAWLAEQGHRAVAPQLAAGWQELRDTPAGIASTWSERHAAYAAGLGTFSLNDALITPKGIAHRCGSVITDLRLTPTPRPYPHFRHNCLYYRNNSCGICIGRCPVGALSFAGHDKELCRHHVYETIPDAVAGIYGVTATGCGLCQTRVPCEGEIPAGAACTTA